MSRLRPNLFIIGAMKSGTTSLHALLGQHPSIFMSEPKEPCYFVDADKLKKAWPEMWRMGFWRSEETYLSLFSSAKDERYVGESSTDYSKRQIFDGVPARIARFNPDSRFVYIMRDPLERTLSHYWHMVEHREERRPILEAFRNDSDYVSTSYYAYQLAPYFEVFGKERVYTLTFEELKRDPVAAARAIFIWLGIDAEFAPATALEARNVTPEEIRQERGSRLLRRFRYSSFWDRAGGLCPRPLRALGGHLVERKVQRSKVDVSEAEDFLRPTLIKQTDELSAMLDREFKEWRRLYAKA